MDKIPKVLAIIGIVMFGCTPVLMFFGKNKDHLNMIMTMLFLGVFLILLSTMFEKEVSIISKGFNLIILGVIFYFLSSTLVPISIDTLTNQEVHHRGIATSDLITTPAKIGVYQKIEVDGKLFEFHNTTRKDIKKGDYLHIIYLPKTKLIKAIDIETDMSYFE